MTANTTRYEIVAPQDGVLTVMLTNLRRSSAKDLLCSFGSRAFIRAVA